jgi:hypothetical protein
MSNDKKETTSVQPRSTYGSWVWNILIAGFVLFSLLPTGYELTRAKYLSQERAFELVHNFPTDYNFYLSRIREGIEGHWTAVEKYTAEPHNGSLIHEMYILMGQVGRFVRVPWTRSGDVYHVARIVLGFTLLGIIAWFCKKSFSGFSSVSRVGMLSFLLAVTASSFPKLVLVDGWIRFGSYMPWWSVMDSLQRITFIPHLLAGQILMLFLIGSLTEAKVLKKNGNIVFLGLIGFFLGMIFPPGLVFVYAVLGVYAGLDFLYKTYRSNKTHMSYLFFSYGGFVLVSCSALLYLFLMTGIYPWKRLAEVDIIRPLAFDYVEYFKAIGPIGPIGLFGLIWALFKKESRMFVAVAWVLAWLGCLAVFHFIPSQSPLRFSEMVPHVALGILGAYFFWQVGHLRFLRYLGNLCAVVLVFLGLGQMWSSWLWQKDFVDHKIRATSPLVPYDSYVMYPLKDFVSAIYFIADQYPREAVLLSEFTAGNYIPVYSGNTVYAGHDNTVHLEQKKLLVKQFFAGYMSEDQAKAFLTENHIRSVFWGPQEKTDAYQGTLDIVHIYPFLSPVYQGKYVTVFDVRVP